MVENMHSKKTVLIVEDENDIREVYSQFLIESGFEVIEATTGIEGIAKAKALLPALVLLDIVIPETDGVHVLKELKQDEVTKNIPIIMLTNLGEDNMISACFEYGAAGYLIKAEITPDKILNEVKNYTTGS